MPNGPAPPWRAGSGVMECTRAGFRSRSSWGPPRGLPALRGAFDSSTVNAWGSASIIAPRGVSCNCQEGKEIAAARESGGSPVPSVPPSDSCRWGDSLRHEAAESRAGDSRRRSPQSQRRAGNTCRPGRAPGLRRDSSRRHEVAERAPDYPGVKGPDDSCRRDSPWRLEAAMGRAADDIMPGLWRKEDS
jgi:hypothetical protein